MYFTENECLFATTIWSLDLIGDAADSFFIFSIAERIRNFCRSIYEIPWFFFWRFSHRDKSFPVRESRFPFIEIGERILFVEHFCSESCIPGNRFRYFKRKFESSRCSLVFTTGKIYVCDEESCAYEAKLSEIDQWRSHTWGVQIRRNLDDEWKQVKCNGLIVATLLKWLHVNKYGLNPKERVFNMILWCLSVFTSILMKILVLSLIVYLLYIGISWFGRNFLTPQ